MERLYDELAEWWPLFSRPGDEYANEAAFHLSLIKARTGERPISLLELGSGGGNNDFHMKQHFMSVTLTDLAPRMLEVSRRLNPDCTHILGDMRSIQLGQTFDVVFVHDAVGYMVTKADLRAMLATAFAHCAPGGLAHFVPDYVRETFKPYTEHGGIDGDGHGMRYLEWCSDPDPADETVVSEFVYMMHVDGQQTHYEYERHVPGLFTRDVWLALLTEAGFTAEWQPAPEGRCMFVAHKA
ncbi:MAG: class I SAM-dependent methyltransferase [Anaerolineae bacterium]